MEQLLPLLQADSNPDLPLLVSIVKLTKGDTTLAKALYRAVLQERKDQQEKEDREQQEKEERERQERDNEQRKRIEETYKLLMLHGLVERLGGGGDGRPSSSGGGASNAQASSSSSASSSTAFLHPAALLLARASSAQLSAPSAAGARTSAVVQQQQPAAATTTTSVDAALLSNMDALRKSLTQVLQRQEPLSQIPLPGAGQMQPGRQLQRQVHLGSSVSLISNATSSSNSSLVQEQAQQTATTNQTMTNAVMPMTKKKIIRRGRLGSFPQKMHQILEKLEQMKRQGMFYILVKCMFLLGRLHISTV